MHRRGLQFLIVLALMMPSALGPMALSVSAAMPVCDPEWANKFLGNGISTPGMIGVYSQIENVSESLCTQPVSPKVPSWSLAWISLDGPHNPVPGWNIYQGGYATCPPPEVGTCPYNGGKRYIWVYYAHDNSLMCGYAFNTGFIKIADATTYATHVFQISKVGSQYNFYVDNVLKYSRSQDDIETCWLGVAAGEWQDEMLNNDDQAGGHVANAQNFGNNRYQDGTGWHNMNRPLGGNCDANSYPAHWHCHTSTSVPNYFVSWDDRVP